MSGSRRVLVLALAGLEQQAERFARQHFGAAEVNLLERAALKRWPFRTLFRAARSPADEFVLYVSDVAQGRTRLVTAIALLVSARRKWVADTKGDMQPLEAGRYLGRDGPVVARHLLAVFLTMLFGPPALLSMRGGLALERLQGSRRRVDVSSAQVPRVAYLRSQFWFGLQAGGSVAHVSGVIGGLQDAGAPVAAISSDRLAGVDVPMVIVRPEVWFVGALRELEELLYNVQFLRAGVRALRAEPPSFLYQRYTALNVSGVLLSRVLRVPLVLEFNSSDVWKARHWGEFRLVPLVQLGEAVNLAGADVIVVVSEVLRDELALRGIETRRILINPNAVDPRIFHPEVSGQAVRERNGLNGKIVVGFSGTFGLWHGVPTLAAALPLISAVEPNVRFLIIGDGPMRPVLDAAVAEHRLEQRVVRVGMVPHDQAPEYLAACDILVAPHGRQVDGREFFGSPTKLFEYMAMGRAIVASHVGQMANVLEHERNALLVEPESEQALAEAVCRLGADATLRAHLGAAARSDAVARHTWKHNAENILTRVAQVGATRPGKAPISAASAGR